MKTLNFVIFFSIVLAIYGSVNYYIFIRGWQSIPAGSSLRAYYLPLFLFVSLSYIAGRILENIWLSELSDILVWIGSFWLAAMLYFFLIILLLDIVRLINHFIPIYPEFIRLNYIKVKGIAGLVSVVTVFAVVPGGYINALNPKISRLNLTIDKSVVSRSSLNIVFASDIHLGTIVGRQRFDRIVGKINELKPDIVLLPGDIVDEDLKPVIRENIGESLRKLKAPLGVYACTGNHEHIGGVEEAYKYLTEHDIVVLRDSVIKVNDEFYLIGREDRDARRFSGIGRKTLEELMVKVDKESPIILMDHQPFKLEEASSNQIDLQISGHTHSGQLWPFNYLTNAIYEVSRGYKKKDNTHVYVSSGVGTWGPPVRTGGRPEIVNIKLNFAH
ncbi:MAG: metallophosphoesterase [Candidatus Zixiibacteriota bacterium]|nr:MAG: metallophosphoesterase [candidate division Zixibacteria bacterium]